MPCLEIKIPTLEAQKKQELAKELTRSFADSSGFPAEIFGIHFHEYEYGDVASGGKICDGQSRPYIHFLLYCPKISRTVKQKLVKEFTKTYVTIIGQSDWAPVIHICEHPYDNVGVDGRLLSDAFPELAESKFYYDLPE